MTQEGLLFQFDFNGRKNIDVLVYGRISSYWKEGQFFLSGLKLTDEACPLGQSAIFTELNPKFPWQMNSVQPILHDKLYL